MTTFRNQIAPANFTIQDCEAFDKKLAALRMGVKPEITFNCGPGAACAVLGIKPADIRMALGDFEQKGYTNPGLMLNILENCGAEWRQVYRSDEPIFGPRFFGSLIATSDKFPKIKLGLIRVQWSGPWTRPGVPMKARYRQTHWVGARNFSREIFDINNIAFGGWMPYTEWSEQLVPWLIRQTCPKADGGWWPTHALEVTPKVK